MKLREARWVFCLWLTCLGFLPVVGLAEQPSTAELCQAAESTINAGKQLASPPTTDLDDNVLDRVHLERGWNGSSTQVSHVVVDGRPMATIVVDSGGTSHDTEVYVLSDDLKSLLSPPDRDARDPENDGGDDWGFGVSEDVVTVLGQPMMRSWRRGSDWPTHLSLINRDGDIVPACTITRQLLKVRKIASSTDDVVCHGVLAGQQAPVPMHPPSPGESLALGIVPPEYRNATRSHAPAESSSAILRYHNTEMASQVTYTLLSTGNADLVNSGKSSHVGLVSFSDGNSTAGDGTYSDTQVFPVFFDKTGVANLSAATNQKLAATLPHGMQDGKLVTLNNTTYLELSPEGMGLPTEVWKIDSSGAHQVCGFKLWRTVVIPIGK